MCTLIDTGYLRQLLLLPDVVHSDILSRWLEVPDSVRPMLMRDQTTHSSATPAGAPGAGAWDRGDGAGKDRGMAALGMGMHAAAADAVRVS